MIVETNIEPLMIRMDGTIRGALERMNATPHLIQIVIDDDKKVCGVVTDGDVRRALVNGAGLDNPVQDCMHRNPLTVDSIEAAIALLPDMDGRHPCIPVINSEWRLTHLVSVSSRTSGLETALVMAGGLGKRLGEHTRHKPKPLVEVGGHPILWHILKDLQTHGIKRVFISTYHLAEQISDFIDGSDFNLQIDTLSESTPLGTAGALGMIPPEIDGPLLIMNGDIVTRVNYAAMMTYHQIKNRDATIGASRFDQEVPFGVLDVDAEGDVVKIQEKPRYEYVVSAGIYIIQPTIYRSVEADTKIDMPNLLRASIERNLRIGLFPIHEYWLDLGRPNDLELAEAELAQWQKS